MDTREELLGKFRAATFSLLFQYEKEEEKKKLHRQIADYNLRLEEAEKNAPNGCLGMGIVIVLFGTSIIGIMEKIIVEYIIGIIHGSDFPMSLVVVCFICGLIALIITGWWSKIANAKYDARIQALKDECDGEIPKLQEEIAKIDTLLSECAEPMADSLKFLPENYRYLRAVVFMGKAIENLRADSLKEAINLYEAHVSDLETKFAMQAAARMQQEQLASINELMQQMNDSQERIADDVNQMKLMQLYEKYNKDYE